MNYFYRPNEAVIEVGKKRQTLTCPLEYDDFYSEIKAVNKALLAGKIESAKMDFNATVVEVTLLEQIYQKLAK